MIRFFGGLGACLLLAFAVLAQQSEWKQPAGQVALELWLHGAPGSSTATGPEADTTTATENLVAGKRVVRLGNVTKPTLTLYAARGKATGAAMVVFPGGGYHILAMDLEGTEVCDWLTSIGVACVLVKYRVPDSGPLPKSEAALQDAQRAVGIVRARAAEWRIDPKRIGVLGFRQAGTCPQL